MKKTSSKSSTPTHDPIGRKIARLEKEIAAVKRLYQQKRKKRANSRTAVDGVRAHSSHD